MSSHETPPIDRPKPMVQQLADRIALDISEGVYPAGSRIRERDLAERFGVSRGPVREALRVLESEQLVVIEPWKGAHVREVGLEEIDDAFELRSVLGGLAARLTAQRADDEEIDTICSEIDHLLSQLGKAKPRDIVTQSQAISRHLFVCSRNARLREIIGQIARTWRQEHSELGIARTPASVRQGRQLWKQFRDALAERDAARAETAFAAIGRMAHAASIQTLSTKQRGADRSTAD